MTDLTSILTALRLGDSFFPSGAISFSWGLEGLAADGVVRDRTDVARFIDGQLRFRWASCDRGAVAGAHEAGDDLDAVASIDEALDRLSLARELREGSARAGSAMLGIHARLGLAVAAAYRRRVVESLAHGHLPVVQGLVWRALGLPVELACAVSGHVLCTGYLGAAVRLGLIGSVDGQKILTELQARLRGLLARPAPAVDSLRAFVPATDIAMMRHESQSARLFAN